MDYINLENLMGLFFNIDNSSTDYKVNFSSKNTEIIKYVCSFYNAESEAGLIKWNLNLYNPNPSINIEIVDNKSKINHLGSYLMACFMLKNASNLNMGSNIQYTGYNDRRRGDLYEIIKDYESENTFGGRKSQLLHLNFGFSPKINNEIFKLFPSLEEFDTSMDFVSKSNNEDSFFSQLICAQMSTWNLNKSETVINLLCNSYNKLIKSFEYIKNYIKINNLSKPNKSSKLACETYSNRLKNNFLCSYNSIYNELLKDFKSLRLNLKKELTNKLDNFTNLIKLNLSKKIPCDDALYSKYFNNIINSRGMVELSCLIEQFNPEIAGIPMPKPENVEKNFDLITDFVKQCN